jgi:5-methylcytosine-specific restriction endonuclease McrA
MARTHGRKGRPWQRIRRAVIGLTLTRGTPCPRCHRALDPDGTWPDRHPLSLSVDHIVPLSIAPQRAHDMSNLRVMHYGCNSSRGDGTSERIRRDW